LTVFQDITGPLLKIPEELVVYVSAKVALKKIVGFLLLKEVSTVQKTDSRYISMILCDLTISSPEVNTTGKSIRNSNVDDGENITLSTAYDTDISDEDDEDDEEEIPMIASETDEKKLPSTPLVIDISKASFRWPAQPKIEEDNDNTSGIDLTGLEFTHSRNAH
jgi:hypothetical protein